MQIRLLAILLLAATCPDDAELGALIGQVNTATSSASPVSGRDDFWKHDYFIRITGWDASNLNDRRWVENQSTPGAGLRISISDLQSGRHCEDGRGEVIYEAAPEDSDDVTFRIRRKGNKTLFSDKGAFKIRPRGRDNRIFGMRTLNLNSNWHNPAQLRQKLAWELFEEAGVPAPRHTYAKFCVKNRYFGLYSVIEQVDKQFLGEHFDNDDGNLYKAYWINEDIGAANLRYRSGQEYFNRQVGTPDTGADWDCRHPVFENPPRPALPKVCRAKRSRIPRFLRAGWDCDEPDEDGFVECEFQRTYQLKTNDDEDDDAEMQSLADLQKFIRTLNGRDLNGAALNSEVYLRQMEDVMNVKGFARWAAVNALLGAWDNYMATPANYYLYNSGTSDEPRFHMVPWDYDNIMGSQWWNTDWATMDLVHWHEDYNGGSRRPGNSNIPLVTNLMANHAFRDYYLDSVACLLNEHFNTREIGKKVELYGNRILPAIYLESARGAGDPGGLPADPRFDHRATNMKVSNAFRPNGQRAALNIAGDLGSRRPHTGSKYNLYQVFYQGLAGDAIPGGTHPSDGQKMRGILNYVSERNKSAWRQIRRVRGHGPSDYTPDRCKDILTRDKDDDAL